MFDHLTDTDLIGELAVTERGITAAQGHQLRLLAELHRRSPGWITPSVAVDLDLDPVTVTAAEVAPVLAVSPKAAVDRVWFAVEAVRRFPAAVAAVAAGRLSLTKLRILTERTAPLPDETAAAVAVIAVAQDGRLTPAMFGRVLARAVLRVDPGAADTRHRTARADRRVEVYPAEDGMAVLRALLPAEQALRMHQALTAAAAAERDADRAAGVADPRSLDARRADLLADALLDPALWALTALVPLDDAPTDPTTAHTPTPADPAESGSSAADSPADHRSRPAAAPDGTATVSAPADPARPVQGSPGRRPRWDRAVTQIHVVVPAAVLAAGPGGPGDDAGSAPTVAPQPAEVTGYGPICDTQARALAADPAGDTGWRRILTDPTSGVVTDVGRSTYHPPAGLADLVRTRDGTCRFPACTRRAHLDLDHTRNYPHGPTAAHNLAALCRSHHLVKTFTRWQVTHHPHGVLVWTSPTGHRYLTHPTGGLRHPHPDDDLHPADRNPGPPPDPDYDPGQLEPTAA